MEKNPPRPMTPFDELVTPQSIYILKLLLPYVPTSVQRMMAIFLKFHELKNTMDTFFGFSSQKNTRSDSILSDLKPYMKPEEQDMMEQMQGMMNMMDMMKQMSDAAGSDTSGSDTSDSDTSASNTSASNTFGSSGFSPFDLMKGMLSPEQQEMFESYNQMFEQGFEKDSGQSFEQSHDQYSGQNFEPNSEAVTPSSDFWKGDSHE